MRDTREKSERARLYARISEGVVTLLIVVLLMALLIFGL